VNVKLLHDGVVYAAVRDDSGVIDLTRADGTDQRLRILRIQEGRCAVETPEGLEPAETARDGDAIWVHFRGRTFRFEISRDRRRRASGVPQGDLTSPMPGQVQRILVAEGETVTAGQPLLVVEAMKMQLEIKAPHAGRVQRVLTEEGQQVEAGAALVELEAAP